MTPTSDNTSDPHLAARQRMVSEQLRARGIRDARVLKVMGDLPREHFIPEPHCASAYHDRAVPIGLDQTISQPYMVALMTEQLDVGRNHRVLEIGTGSGYQTAILAKLAKHVYTVERLADLSTRARETLDALDITNVTFTVADGTVGWSEHAPYDRIMVTAGAPHVPDPLIAQLVDGGIIIIPVGPEDHQDLLRVHKSGGKIREESVVACRFVRLVGQDGWPNRRA